MVMSWPKVTGFPKFTAPPAVRILPFSVVVPPPLVTATLPNGAVVPNSGRVTVAVELTGLIVRLNPVVPLPTELIAPVAANGPERLRKSKLPPMFTGPPKVTAPEEVTCRLKGLAPPTAPEKPRD